MATGLTPAVFNTIQSQFIEKLSGAFGIVGTYAHHLFYLIAVIELTLFGVIWALKRDDLIADFLFKVLKLGVIFTAIAWYPLLVQALINGFTQVALQMTPQAAGIMLKPAQIWQYGFDNSMSLLNLATQYGTANIGASMLYLALGLGTLLLFALIGAQIVLVMVMFYVVALVALLLIPFGVFAFAGNLFEKALQALFRAGVRVLVTILVIGVGVGIWQGFQIEPATTTTTLMGPLGLLFSAIVLLVLVYQLPRYAVEAVGEFRATWFATARGGADISAAAPATINASSSLALVAAATQVPVNSGASASVFAGSNLASGSDRGNGAIVAAGSSMVYAQSVSAALQTTEANRRGKVGEGAQVAGGFSREAAQQLKATVKQALAEKGSER